MCVNRGAYLFKVAVCKELLERAVGLVCPAYVGESLCTDALGVLDELVYLLAGVGRGAILNVDGADASALFNCVFEYDKVNVLDRGRACPSRSGSSRRQM